MIEMSGDTLLGPELERDENGKLRCVPFQIPAEFRAKKSPSVRKSTVERKRNIKLPLERLILNPADLEDSPKQPAKVRKVEEKSVRKELFKVPQRVAQTRSQQRQTLSRQSLSGSAGKSVRSRFQQGVAPLSEISEESTRLTITTSSKVRRGYSFKSPSDPVINFSKPARESVKFLAVPKKDSKNVPNKPNISPDSEFLQLERSCATPKRIPSAFASPSAAICNLMHNTRISDKQPVTDSNKKTDKTETLNLVTVIETVRNIIVDDEKDFQMLTQRHENRVSQLKSLLKSLEECESHNKENAPTRRSGRLASRNSINGNENTNSVKISVNASDSARVTSPAISRSVDLRKATLNNNLARNIKTESVTPRGNKAINMYNSMRNEFPFLCTPKLSTTTPKSQTGTRAISKTLQNQLLLLQQTPSHK